MWEKYGVLIGIFLFIICIVSVAFYLSTLTKEAPDVIPDDDSMPKKKKVLKVIRPKSPEVEVKPEPKKKKKKLPLLFDRWF